MAGPTHSIELSKDQIDGLTAGDDVMIPTHGPNGEDANINVSYKGDEEPTAQPEEKYGTEETYGEEGKVETGALTPQEKTPGYNESVLLKFDDFLKL